MYTTQRATHKITTTTTGAADPATCTIDANASIETVDAYFTDGGRQRTNIYDAGALAVGACINGPALLIQPICVIVVEPGWIASRMPSGDIAIRAKGHAASVTPGGARALPRSADPVMLSIFAHRFMGIAEQMGRTLQRTSLSVNIKERLDFSCALFDQV